MPAQSLPKSFGGWGGIHLAPDLTLLFTSQGVLYSQGADTSEQPGQAIYLRGDQLLFTRLIQILLYAGLEFCGVEGDGLKPIVVEYNVIGYDLLNPAPALQCFLSLAWARPRRRPHRGFTASVGRTVFQAQGRFTRLCVVAWRMLVMFCFPALHHPMGFGHFPASGRSGSYVDLHNVIAFHLIFPPSLMNALLPR